MGLYAEHLHARNTKGLATLLHHIALCGTNSSELTDCTYKCTLGEERRGKRREEVGGKEGGREEGRGGGGGRKEDILYKLYFLCDEISFGLCVCVCMYATYMYVLCTYTFLFCFVFVFV